jgi:general secretion pathway protein K
VALAILVWFLAAMSILVASMVSQARMDIRLAQLQIEQAEAEAAGDGAIQLALAELLIREQAREFNVRQMQISEFTVGDARVTVRIIPVAGLIDLNSAQENLLIALFSTNSGSALNNGQELAQNVIKWRLPGAHADPMGPAPESYARRFQAVEDLLSVNGINRGIYERVKDSIYVAAKGQAGVDWLSAPESVLTLLSGGDETLSRELGQSRLRDQQAAASDVGGTVPVGLDMQFQKEGALPLFRVDALVKLHDGNYRRRRWVDRSKSGSDGLPWSFFRSEALAAINKEERNFLTFVGDTYAGG